MGLLDSILSEVKNQRAAGSSEDPHQHKNLIETAMGMFGSNAALSGLLNNAQHAGMGSVVDSWVRSGPNQPIGAQQIEQLLGQERINEIASKLGVSPETANQALARVLPVLVDKLTPHGKLPEAA